MLAPSKSNAKIASFTECFGDAQVMLIMALALVDHMDSAITVSTFKVLETEFGMSISGLATMSFVQAAGSKISSPIWGWMCDDLIASRKTLLMIGCCGWGSCMVAVGLSNHLWQVFLFRFLNGIFLASLLPLSQSWVPDLANPDAYGCIFGLIGLVGTLGGALSAGLVISLTGELLYGLPGWRVVSFAVGFASWGLGLLIFKCEMEQSQASSHGVTGPFEVITKMLQTLSISITTPSFIMLIMQDVISQIPWIALQFEAMYMMYLGFSNMQVGLYKSVTGICSMPGPLLGGLIGDALARRNADHGRVVVGPLTVALGIPFFVILLYVLPKTVGTAAVWPFMICSIAFHLVTSWSETGMIRPMLCEMMPKTRRATGIAWFNSFRGLIAHSIALPILGFLPEKVFGYQRATTSIAEMPETEQQMNVFALRNVFLWLGIVPWVLSFGFYYLLYSRYPKDRAALAKKLLDKDDEERASLVQNVAK